MNVTISAKDVLVSWLPWHAVWSWTNTVMSEPILWLSYLVGKPGTCPRSMGALPSKSFCSCDNECPGKMKCCNFNLSYCGQPTLGKYFSPLSDENAQMCSFPSDWETSVATGMTLKDPQQRSGLGWITRWFSWNAERSSTSWCPADICMQLSLCASLTWVPACSWADRKWWHLYWCNWCNVNMPFVWSLASEGKPVPCRVIDAGARLCTANKDCPKGWTCYSNGCGHLCAPPATGNVGKDWNNGFWWMGCLSLGPARPNLFLSPGNLDCAWILSGFAVWY